jgi:hypothetical protein
VLYYCNQPGKVERQFVLKWQESITMSRSTADIRNINRNQAPNNIAYTCLKIILGLAGSWGTCDRLQRAKRLGPHKEMTIAHKSLLMHALIGGTSNFL